MPDDATLSRRAFLTVTGSAGALIVAAPALIRPRRAEAAAFTAFEGAVGPYVRINPDNSVIIGNPNTEIGQGTSTSIPMLIAEELDVDFDRVTVELLPLKLERGPDGTLRYAVIAQGAGGSTSVWDGWEPARQAGAAARRLLLEAAARRWGVSVESLTTEPGTVVDRAGGRRAHYGDLAEAAAKLPLPEGDLALKDRSEHRIIGTDQRHKNVDKIVTGEPIFGIDMEMPGMLHAVVARSPYLDGTVASIDDAAARAIPGVRHIVPIERPPLEQNYQQLAAGVAVVADDLWTALKARAALNITWARGPMAEDSAAEFARARERMAAARGQIVRDDGDVDAALNKAARVVEASYEVPLVSHAPLEPQNTIAWVRQDSVDIISPTQSPGSASRVVEQLTGVDRLAINMKIARCGGGFGRRLYVDQVAEAVLISQAIGNRPVKLVWSREDDLQHDFYRPGGCHHFVAALDGEGRVTAWTHRLASHARIFRHGGPKEEFWQSEFFPDDFPAALLDNMRLEYFYLPSAAPRGYWRAPVSTSNAFAVQSFVDEIAHAGGRDPLDVRLDLLGEARDMAYDGHGGPTYNTGRLAGVLRLAAEQAGWGERLPAGRGRGIAAHFTFGTYVAHVVDVSVSDGDMTVDRVVSAVDCGIPVNPNGIRAQMEGGINDALSTALGQEITIVGGEVQQKNFDSYEMMRIDRSPRKIEVHIHESGGPIRGMGEPPVPPFAPALTNAVYSATGRRIRKLPIADQLRTT